MATQTISLGTPTIAITNSGTFSWLVWNTERFTVSNDIGFSTVEGVAPVITDIRITSNNTITPSSQQISISTIGGNFSDQFDDNWAITFDTRRFVHDDFDTHAGGEQFIVSGNDTSFPAASDITDFQSWMHTIRAGNIDLLLDDGDTADVDIELELQAGSPSIAPTIQAQTVTNTDITLELTAGAPSISASVDAQVPGNVDLILTLEAGLPQFDSGVEAHDINVDIDVDLSAGRPRFNSGIENLPPPDNDITVLLHGGRPQHSIQIEAIPTLLSFDDHAGLPIVRLPMFSDNKLALLIGQWESAPNLTALLTLLAEYFDEQVTEVINYLYQMLDINTSVGVWLDFLAARLNLVRPTVLASQYSATFGFDDAGTNFGDVRIRDIASLEPLLPIDDILFRKLIWAKTISTTSVPTIPALRTAVDYFDTNAKIRDNFDMTVQIVSNIHQQIQIAHDAHTLPKPSGVKFEITDSERFGFDDAGAGFNQGIIR